MIASRLYVGEVTHQRLRAVSHALRYRIFMLLLDLEEVEGLLGRLRLLGRGRFGLMSFDPRDHGDGSNTPLRTQVEARLAQAGIVAQGPVRLLCMPRVLGYGFNPISVYYCHHTDGRLKALLYEVTNTFGDRHSYLIACDAAAGDVVIQTAAKEMHVSPFMEMDLTYRFTVRQPTHTVAIAIRVEDAGGPLLGTAFVGAGHPLSDAALLRAWFAHPLLTWKVIAGIHWEALRLFSKGVGLQSRPPAPAQAVTIVKSTDL
jgi:DUF1365 family protein